MGGAESARGALGEPPVPAGMERERVTYRMYMMTPRDHMSQDLSYFSGPSTSGAGEKRQTHGEGVLGADKAPLGHRERCSVGCFTHAVLCA